MTSLHLGREQRFTAVLKSTLFVLAVRGRTPTQYCYLVVSWHHHIRFAEAFVGVFLYELISDYEGESVIYVMENIFGSVQPERNHTYAAKIIAIRMFVNHGDRFFF